MNHQYVPLALQELKDDLKRKFSDNDNFIDQLEPNDNSYKNLTSTNSKKNSKDDIDLRESIKKEFNSKVIKINSDLFAHSSSLAKSLMKQTKGQAIEKIGSSDIYKTISKNINIDSSKIITTSTQVSDTFVSSATHTSNPNQIGNLRLEENQCIINDNTVESKSLRFGAINTHHLNGDADIRGSLFKDDEENDIKDINSLKDIIIKNFNENKRIGEINILFKKLGIKSSELRSWKSFMQGGHIDDSLLYKKLNQKLALRNKVLDLAKAAYDAAPADKKNKPIVINSFSLLTPDLPRDIKAKVDGGHSERAALNEQIEAFHILENMDSTEICSVFDIGEENELKFEVNAFNFGVNEGAEIGFSKQQKYNEIAMKRYLSNIKEDLNNFEEGSNEKMAAESLLNDIESSYSKYKGEYINPSTWRLGSTFHSNGNWRADKAYDLIAKMQCLADVTSSKNPNRYSINTTNCASGKDRTGFQRSSSINYFSLYHERLFNLPTSSEFSSFNTKTTYEEILENFDSFDSYDNVTIDKNTKTLAKIESLQNRNLIFLLESGQLEVQEQNTGSKGYKTYGDKMPQFITGNLKSEGGKTTEMIQLYTGLTQDEVANKITRTAKYNDT